MLKELKEIIKRRDEGDISSEEADNLKYNLVLSREDIENISKDITHEYTTDECNT